MDQEAFFRKLVDFTAAVHQVKHELTKDLPLGSVTPVQYGILEYIAVHQPVTLSEISDCQHMSMPNTSRELKKLTEKNLCEKSIAAEDQRKQYIRLSPEGQRMMDDIFRRIHSRFEERIRTVPEEGLKAIDRAMDVLRAQLFDTSYAKK
ncbi:MarR family winged helix-turn-helix transcriptional regulator [Cohnella zeiphila]|uniref:MarR family transcriptional regulator n=1 Tax=Cohnella zeiphila TaxID=2761120 RepID=A0A7X0VYR8_9BACL|nr:MarR family transcriptional regulator [Cohnella zeiphila]MBB6733223.1 MarR family transcriptional regulator [Cohnella zeiphila]